MADLEEVKKLFEDSFKKVHDLRAELDAMAKKSEDYVSREKVSKLEADLADSIAAREVAQAELKAVEDRLAAIEAKAFRPGKPGAGDSDVDEYKSVFLDWMRDPRNHGVEAKVHELSRKATDVRGTTGASGGFAVPEEIAREVARVVQDLSPIRQISRVVSIGTPDYKELVDTTGFEVEWVGETGTRSQTDTPNLAEVAPTLGTIAAKPQATVESLDDLFFDVEAWLVDSASRQYAIAEGQAFVAGNGTNRPTGFLAGPTPVATADASRAFGTLQYIPTGNASTLGTNPFDVMIDTKATLKAGYRTSGRWVMSSATQATLAKVKATDGQYLLQPSLVAGTPDMMVGSPVTIAEDMPAIAGNAFPIAYGDFTRGYLIVDRVGMRIIRDEVTTPGYVKWIISRRVGGKLKDTNAIKLVKVAAS